MTLKLSLFSNLTSKNCDNIENIIIKELNHEAIMELNPELNTQKDYSCQTFNVTLRANTCYLHISRCYFVSLRNIRSHTTRY